VGSASVLPPRNENYWEGWIEILSSATYTADDGRKFTLHQDGDLWAICHEQVTQEERENFGFEE